MFKNFRNFNRDLTKAYLRQAETQSLFEKAKGGALPEHQIKQKKEDDATFRHLGNLFNTMHRRCRYGQPAAGVEQSASFTPHKKVYEGVSSLGASLRASAQDRSSSHQAPEGTVSNTRSGQTSPPQFGAQNAEGQNPKV